MKYLYLCFVFLLINGCAYYTNTDYKPWQGNEQFCGKGGAKTIIGDHYEVWEYGEPDKHYKILGIIEQSNSHSVFNGYCRKKLLAILKEQKADGVVLTNKERILSGVSKEGNAHYSQKKVFAVFKYVKQNQ